MNRIFLLIVDNKKVTWSNKLERALSTLGRLTVVNSEEDGAREIKQNEYDIIILETGITLDIANFITHIRSNKPNAKVIISSASPTWQRARQAFLAGAVDYMSTSLDEKEIRSIIQSVLKIQQSS